MLNFFSCHSCGSRNDRRFGKIKPKKLEHQAEQTSEALKTSEVFADYLKLSITFLNPGIALLMVLSSTQNASLK